MPTQDAFADRRRMREDGYFGKSDQELIERDLNTLQQQMAERCGVSDPDVLRALEKAGYSSETIPVLHVVPLVQVAWADGHVSQGERLSILEAAEARDLQGGAAYERLLDLLDNHPSQHFFDTSLQAIRSALLGVPPAKRLSMQRDLISSCTKIASVSRSAIGHKISNKERCAINRISAELGRANRIPAVPLRATTRF